MSIRENGGTDAGVAQVTEVPWDEFSDSLRKLREQVFELEQSVPREIEWDGRDKESRHFLVELFGKPIGCGRVLPEGKIGRMAILPEYRGCGHGARLLKAIIDTCHEHHYPRLYLHAQQHAEAFYSKAGFQRLGDVFQEAEIPHVAMELPAVNAQLDFPEGFAQRACDMIARANRQLAVMSPVLDHRVFHRKDFCAAVADLARRSRFSQVRILIQDSGPLVRRGHRLLYLARRLDSAVEIRKLGKHPELSDDTLVIADSRDMLLKPALADRGVIWRSGDRGAVTRHLEQFNLLWERSRPDVELRQLRI